MKVSLHVAKSEGGEHKGEKEQNGASGQLGLVPLVTPYQVFFFGEATLIQILVLFPCPSVLFPLIISLWMEGSGLMLVEDIYERANQSEHDFKRCDK